MERLTKKLEPIEDSVEAISRWIQPYKDPDADLSRITTRGIELKQAAIISCAERYEKIYEEILALIVDRDDKTPYKNKYFDFVNSTMLLDSDLELVKNRLPIPNNNNAQNQNQQIVADGDQSIKFPKRELLKFEGGVLDWSSFVDNFFTEVISCQKLSDGLRMGYLKTCVVGEAASLIKNLKQTDENFQIAWSLLKEFYEDDNLIRDAHFDKLFGIKVMVEQSPAALRKLSTILIEHLQGLRNLKEPVEKWDSWLIYLLKTKLDSTSRKEWERHLVSQKIIKPTVENLKTFLHQMARMLETCPKAKSTGNFSNPIKSSPRFPPSNTPSHRAMVVKKDFKILCV